MVTRGKSGHEDALIERFTSPRTGRMARDINASCYEALMTTAADKERLAHVFVELGSQPRPRATTQYCADGIRDLGELGFAVALDTITSSTDGAVRLRRARLVARAAKMRMPETPDFWRTAETEAVQAAVDAWRGCLSTRGLVGGASDALGDADSIGMDTNGAARATASDAGDPIE